MKIRCKVCGEFFNPDDETMELMSEGYITSDSVNICDECWNLQQLSEYGYTESLSYSDPVL